MGVKLYLTVALNCTLLLTQNGEHLSVCLLVMYIFSLRNFCSNPLPVGGILVVFFLFSHVSDLCTMTRAAV